jgi:outer membrane protein assembly factor BamB
VVTEGEYAAGEGYTLRRGAGTYPGGGNRDILTGEPTEIAGQLQANDPVNSRTVWSVEWTVNNNVPVMATAGGLIFQGGSNAGVMRAFDAATGDLAWEFPLGSSFSASSTTYIGPDGRQYVAIIASASNTGQVNFDDDADDADRYRRGGATLFVFALPQSVAGGM